MRLTKQLKDAFVNAVIADIPATDYIEKAQKAIQEFLDASAPKEVLRTFKLSPEYFDVSRINVYDDNDNYVGTVNVYLMTEKIGSELKRSKVWDRVKSLCTLESQQKKARKNMMRELDALIAPFGTIKSAKTSLPKELIRYLPKEEEKTLNLPALAETVDNLKKLGWKGMVAA